MGQKKEPPPPPKRQILNERDREREMNRIDENIYHQHLIHHLVVPRDYHLDDLELHLLLHWHVMMVFHINLAF